MIAVPIVAESTGEAESQIRQANKKADLIELRLDFLAHVNETLLKEMLEKCSKPVIATFRAKHHGASTEATERMFLLKKAIQFGAEFIDLDFEEDKGFIPDIAKHKGRAALIISSHNFEETPPLPELLQRLEEMHSLGCGDVFKIIAFAREERDNDTALALVKAAKEQGLKIVAFCMGPKGIRSRVECIKMGALFTFASLERGRESAPGQIPVDELKRRMEND